MKRLISCYASDFKDLSPGELKTSIQASEGRTIVGETVVTAAPLLEGVSNAEVMAAFGADLILLNEFDVFDQAIVGLEPEENMIEKIKYLTGRPVGINLEPVDLTASVSGERIQLSLGRKASIESFEQASQLGVDFIILTGNPSSGVTVQSIQAAVSVAKAHYPGMIIAGKMHGAGTSEEIIDEAALLSYIEEGADGVLVPTVGTVPGVGEGAVSQVVKAVHAAGGIVLSSIGTSQESADEETIKSFGLSNKRVGSDIHHIGDGGYGRMPIPENILALSIAVRGRRHTYFRMSQSIRR